MNNIKDYLQRAWLRTTKVGEGDGRVTLRGEMFDGTPFDFVVTSHEYESSGSESSPLVEVGLTGDIATICEIVLPAPALSYGHRVRVSQSSLIKWDVYNKIKEKNESAKKGS